MALSYAFPLSPFPPIHSSFNFPFMIFLAPGSKMSPPQSDPEFYSVTYRAAGAVRGGGWVGKKGSFIHWAQRNKTTFLPLSPGCSYATKMALLHLPILSTGCLQTPTTPTCPPHAPLALCPSFLSLIPVLLHHQEPEVLPHNRTLQQT